MAEPAPRHRHQEWLKFLQTIEKCQGVDVHLILDNYATHDVDGYFREVQAKGVQGLRPPQDKPWGMREFSIRTPDGHRLMVGKSTNS